MAIGNGVGEFTGSLTGLSLNSTYYIRAYAINSLGIGYSEQRSFTTKNGLATVTTGTATTTATSIAVGGNVTDNGGYAVTERGVCYSSTNSEPMITDAFVAGGKGNGEFSVSITGLSPSTTYYIRAYATNENGISYGETITVVTQSGIPIVSTTQTTATSTNITSGGEITDDGGYNIIARGVCYSTSNSTPTIEDSYTTAGMGTGTFSTIITNVTVSTTYYVRAYATNSIGTSYGLVYSVTTGDGLPSVTTTTIGENVTSTTATGGGNVTDDGGYAVTARGVCWSTLPNPTIADSKTVDGGGKGYFTSTITGIDFTNAEAYYIRAYATNANGTSYGNQVQILKEEWEYKNLPKIEYDGYIYILYHDMGKRDWNTANTICENLVFGGYDDWRLPTKTELTYIMVLYKNGWYDADGSPLLYIPESILVPNGEGKHCAYYWTSNKSADNYYWTLFYRLEWYNDGQGVYGNYHSDTPIATPQYYQYSQRFRPIRRYPKNQ